MMTDYPPTGEHLRSARRILKERTTRQGSCVLWTGAPSGRVWITDANWPVRRLACWLDTGRWVLRPLYSACGQPQCLSHLTERAACRARTREGLDKGSTQPRYPTQYAQELPTMATYCPRGNVWQRIKAEATR